MVEMGELTFTSMPPLKWMTFMEVLEMKLEVFFKLIFIFLVTLLIMDHKTDLAR